MSFIAYHQDCPKCGHKECASLREDGSLYCHSVCSGNVFPEGWKPKEPPKAVKGGWTDYRGISAETLREYGVVCGFDEHGNLVRVKYPYKQHQENGEWVYKFKYKLPYPYTIGNKKVTNEGAGTKLHYLFGREFNAGSSTRIYLTSGEEDCLTVYEALGKKFPVKSLPSDTIHKNLLPNELEYLSSFKEIIWVGDSDESGKKAAEKLYATFPDKFYYVPLTLYKDANAFVWDKDKNEPKSAEDRDALVWALRNGKKRYAPKGIYVNVDDFTKIIDEENPYQFTPTPCAALNDKIKGFTKGGMTLLKALPGVGKCLGPDVPVMLYDGSVKKAKDVVVGDQLMGDDGAPRNVLSTTTGTDEMFEIIPVKGDSWVCNSVHVLSLRLSGTNLIKDIPLNKYLADNSSAKERLKQFRVPVESFGTDHELPMDPYLFGLFAGDGSKRSAKLYLGLKKTNCVNRALSVLDEMGLDYNTKWNSKHNYYEISIRTKDRKHGTNPFIRFDVDSVSLYKTSMWQDRIDFLCGILDSDGHYRSGGFEICQKDYRIAEAVLFVSRSLGHAAYMSDKVVNGVTYYRISISGDFSGYNFTRHVPEERKQIKNVLNTGFSVKSLGQGTYYGFEIDGNKRFLLGDFTVTHNTSLLRYFQHYLIKNTDQKVAVLHMEETKSTTIRGMVTYEMGVDVNTKESARANGVSEEAVKACVEGFLNKDNFILFEISPSRYEDLMDHVLEMMRICITVFGADYIFLDHAQRLAYLSGVENATVALTEFSVKVEELCKKHDVGFWAISHVNNDGDVKYAKSLAEGAIQVIEISRDKNAESDVERNTTLIEVTKNRPFSRLGEGGKLYYDSDTTTLTEIT